MNLEEQRKEDNNLKRFACEKRDISVKNVNAFSYRALHSNNGKTDNPPSKQIQ